MRGFCTSLSRIPPVSCAVLLILAALQLVQVTPQNDDIYDSPTEACKEFLSGADGLAWKLSDCAYVWSKWVATIPPSLRTRYQERELLSAVAGRMRNRGTPCLVESDGARDGVGSSTIRHMATWMLASEIGCDWVTPEWIKPTGPTPMEPHTSVYCHSKTTVEERQQPRTVEERIASRSCQVVSWLYYFHYDIPSVDYPQDAITNMVTAEKGNPVELAAAIDEAVHTGLGDMPWDTLVLKVTQQMASRYMVSVRGWDSFKRGIVKDVLEEMRENFHASPRPW